MEQYVYRPLRRYPLALPPPDQQRVQLSLDDLATLLGPRSRSGFPTWTPLGVVDAAEIQAGCRARFDRQRATITFSRGALAPQEPA